MYLVSAKMRLYYIILHYITPYYIFSEFQKKIHKSLIKYYLKILSIQLLKYTVYNY